jgi:hypothetical protein
MFHLIKTTVLPLVIFFMTTKEKHQCYPLFYLINIDSITPVFFLFCFFMTTNKKTVLFLMFFIS